jgi:hypothetical protein
MFPKKRSFIGSKMFDYVPTKKRLIEVNIFLLIKKSYFSLIFNYCFFLVLKIDYIYLLISFFFNFNVIFFYKYKKIL